MGNNSNSFKSVKSENNSYSIPKGKIGFARGFLVPFVAGVLGTLIIVGGCISIPSIRETISEKLLSDSSKSESSTKSNDESSVESLINKVVSSSSDKAVSVEDYSNTSIAVANKVLPSVVGITVTYSVNSPYYSYYGMSEGTAKATGSGVVITDDGYI